MTKLTRQEKDILSTFGDAIVARFEAMTEDEVRLVLSASKAVTTSNCWWLSYRLAPILGQIAADELRHRDSNSDPQGGDANAAPDEASQSGGEAASPNPSLPSPPPPKDIK